MRTFAAIFIIAVLATRIPAQTPAGVPAVDSAHAARIAWSAGLRALRADDLVTAQARAAEAGNAWPTQGAYHWYHAVLSARRNDTAAAREALRDYAELGLGRDLRDTTFDRLRQLPWFDSLAALHDRNRIPLARSRTIAVLSDSTLWPEAVDQDPATGNIYVTSVRHRTVVELARDGRERDLWPRGQDGMGAMLGVRFDRSRGVLWVTTSGMSQAHGFVPADTAIAALLQVSVTDGSVLRRWELAGGGRAEPGDLAVGPSGDVFVTDSRNPVLYVLRSGADSIVRVEHPMFRSLQGVAPAPDGNVVYLADYSHGLLRLDLARREVTRVGDPPRSTTLGLDGIILHDNAIIAVQNGFTPARVMRFALDPAGTRIVEAVVLDRNSTVADEPTVGSIVGAEFVYVANSQWGKYDEDGSRIPGTALARPVLLAVPLAKPRAP